MKKQENEKSNLLTIIIPFYNSESTLYKTLESVTQQSNDYWNIILVNDGSTDNSIQIAESFRVLFEDRITLIECANNGQSKAKDLGAEIVTTKWVMFLDSDDLLENNVLSKIFITLEQGNYDVILFDYSVQDNTNTVNINNNKYDKYELSRIDIIDNLKINVSPILWNSNLIYSSKFIRDNKLIFDIKKKLDFTIININYMQGEDNMFATSALFMANKIKYQPISLAKYVQNRASVSYSFNFSRLGAFYNNAYILSFIKKIEIEHWRYRIISNYYRKGALNGLIYNFYVLRKSFERINGQKVNYYQLLNRSKFYYPNLIKDYRVKAFENIFSKNCYQISSYINLSFCIFPVFTMYIFDIYIERRFSKNLV